MSNMGDDIASVTLQVSTQVAGTAAHAAEKTMDIIEDVVGKLMRLLSEVSKKLNNDNNVKSTDLTDIKSGAISPKELSKSKKIMSRAAKLSTH